MKRLAFLLLCFASLFAQVPSDIDVLDRTVPLDNASLHAIVTKPKAAGRYPAVLVISGLGCYPLDPPEDDSPFNQLRYGLGRQGYVTMWVEKNGQGSSQGPPCDSPQSDLQFAARRSIAGLKTLAEYDFVDRDNIFILAHSIGPLEGVLVAQNFPVRGFIASETIGKSWFEYGLENARRQLRLLGRPYDVIDKYVRVLEKCQHRFSVEKQLPDQILKDMPECKDSMIPSVSASYLQQVAGLDLAVEWKKVDVPVLVTWGTSDPTTSAEENRYLAEIINSFHPGRATYAEFPGMGHGLDLWPSQREWLESIRKKKHTEFDSEFLKRVVEWLKQNQR
ncbi:MAG TPA: alpha/beta fold hydrolase [Candidatus Angelobacter sp.]|nr:alpha/beta fold hydrolase [Candidatus Angelobacter sp.]